METPQHISELNSAIALSSLDNAIALFSSEMCWGVSKSTSHPRTMMCGHGKQDCEKNKCVCLDEWSTAPAVLGSHSLVEACTVCSLSCASLDKEVVGGDNCHCTFNTLHLTWMVGLHRFCYLLLLSGLMSSLMNPRSVPLMAMKGCRKMRMARATPTLQNRPPIEGRHSLLYF